MSAASDRANRHSVLPPIIPESEKDFLESIQNYIFSEIENVGCTEQGPAEQYYIIYKNVFEMIIEHVNAYKNILTTIKQEYDAFIEAIKKGHQTAFYLHGKLKVLACESTTLMYYRKRISQLTEKIRKIENDSARTKSLIQKVRLLRTMPSKDSSVPSKKVNPAQQIPEDYIFIVQQCPSVQLMRYLTQEWNGNPPFLSLGSLLLTLLNTEQKIYCLRLLEELAKEGSDVLENKIVHDSDCTVEVWKNIAEICQATRREKLSKLLFSILAAQEGVVEVPPDDADAKLMEHVFL